MSDIVEKLRAWVYTDSLYATAIEAAEEIERLRFAVAAYTSGISAGVDSKPTLTDEERAAVAYFAAFHRSPREADANAAATLRALLSRTGSGLRQTRDSAPECRAQGEKTPERDR